MIKIQFKQSLTLLIFICLCPLGLAQTKGAHEPFEDLNKRLLDMNYTLNVLDYSKGLPISSVRRISQDDDGLMWFGTNSGVIIYNGYQFEMIDDLSCEVYAFYDSNQYMWVGTSFGLYKINKTTRIAKAVSENTFGNMRIESIASSDNGVLWIGATRGLYRYCPEESNQGEMVELAYSGDVKRVLIDSQQRIWLATWTGPKFYDPISAETITLLSGSPLQKQCYNIFEDNQGDIWFGFINQGLGRVVNDNQGLYIQLYKNDPLNKGSIANNMVFSISQEPRSGDIWVGTQSGFSALKDRENQYSFENYRCYINNSGRVFNDINWIYQDNLGVMWLASLYNGVLQIDPNKSYVEHNALRKIALENSTAMIIDIAYVDPSTYFLNIKGRGIFRYNPLLDVAENIEDLLIANGAKVNQTTGTPSLTGLQYVKETQTLIYKSIGNRHYQIQLDGRDPISIEYYSLKNNKSVNMLFIDKSLNKWIFSSNALIINRANKPSITTSHFNNVEPTAYCQDHNGHVWIGTKIGEIYRTTIQGDSLSLSQYSSNEEHKYKVVSLYSHPQSGVWAGTVGGGLLHLDEQEQIFKCVNQEYNLEDNTLFNIFGVDEKMLYMSTYSGLARVNIEDKSVSIYPSSILSNNHFDPISSYCSINDSTYLLGGVNGYNKLKIAQLRQNNIPPDLILWDVRAKGQSIINDSDKYQRIDKKNYKLTLPKSHNSVEFQFIAPNYSESTGGKYSYMLCGVDNQWQFVDASSRRASYAYLAKGKYQFILKASNENGVWCDKPIVCYLVIKPAIYETWWAYTLYVVCLLLAIAFSIWRVRNRFKLKMQILSIKHNEAKAAEMNDLKLKFFTNISHELLTPLSVIKCTVEEMEQGSIIDNSQNRIITSNIDRLMRLIRQIIEFRKVESDNLKLKVSHGSIASVIESICQDSFQSIAAQRQIHLSLVKASDDIEGYFDLDKVDKIIHNLLSNAFKYNKSDGFVLVNLQFETDNQIQWAVISIRDSGIGISKDQIESVFNRFYDGEYRRVKTTGSGIGLSLSKELASLHFGTLTVDSQIDVGSTFVLRIPLDKKIYLQNGVEVVEAPTLDDSPKQPQVKSLSNSNYQEVVLIVEDNYDLQESIYNSLSKCYRILQAYDGAQAYEIIASENIDIIICDIMMPKVDGIELCHRLKENVDHCHIPIIMLTANITDDMQAEAYRLGVNAYLTKPFSIKVLKSRIYNLLLNKNNLAEQFKQDDTALIQELVDNSVDKRIMNSIMTIIQENVSNEEFNWSMICPLVNLSQSTMYRKIKSITGMSPGDFIRNTRLKEAKSLLRGDNILTISQTAYAVGFSDPKYFSMCFKKEFGVTPTQYQRGKGRN